MRLSCPVCGDELREHVSGCSTCPMNSGCEMVCCENCGYETVAPRSKVIDFVRGLFQRKVKPHGAS
jgi:hypothetical protein